MFDLIASYSIQQFHWKISSFNALSQPRKQPSVSAPALIKTDDQHKGSKIMNLITRKAALLLTTAAALVGLFWLTAFTTEDVTQGQSSVALNAPAITAAPTSISKPATAMKMDGPSVRQGTSG
jgi:hypothetical protein